MSPDRKALTYALTAVLCWSTVATAFKIALSHADLFQLLFISSLTASAILSGIVLVQGRGPLLLEEIWRCYIQGDIGATIRVRSGKLKVWKDEFGWTITEEKKMETAMPAGYTPERGDARTGTGDSLDPTGCTGLYAMEDKVSGYQQEQKDNHRGEDGEIRGILPRIGHA